MTYKVFTLKLARQLIEKGFNCIEVLPNRDKPWLNVYGFENTQELKDTVTALTSK